MQNIRAAFQQCIARQVIADERYQRHTTDLGDLIIDAVPE
jgi:hypothetical protein